MQVKPTTANEDDGIRGECFPIKIHFTYILMKFIRLIICSGTLHATNVHTATAKMRF